MRGKAWTALSVLGSAAAFAGAAAMAAAPDWNKVPKKTITVFHPGVASLEWTLTGGEHGGARAMRKGETCASCHHEETADMGKKIVAGEKAEPQPIKGRAGSIPVTVQAAHDGANLYLRFQWKGLTGTAKKQDEKNQVKVAVMFDDNRVEYANIGGCWASCHDDLRTMPDVNPDAARHPKAKELDIRKNGPTKYLKESRTDLELKTRPKGGWDKLRSDADIAAALKAGKFLEIWQFRSGEGPRDGYVLDARRMKAAPGLAEGRNEGGVWTVTFTRKLAGGGPGQHTFAAGRSYNMGFAIHDDYSNERWHHVSLGYTLGLDNPKADINAVKQ